MELVSSDKETCLRYSLIHQDFISFTCLEPKRYCCGTIFKRYCCYAPEEIHPSLDKSPSWYEDSAIHFIILLMAVVLILLFN